VVVVCIMIGVVVMIGVIMIGVVMIVVVMMRKKDDRVADMDVIVVVKRLMERGRDDRPEAVDEDRRGAQRRPNRGREEPAG